jgi:phosphoglycolate/pyridoxal phosphate phosphatase family enzyme
MAIADDFDGFLIDLDGVVYVGHTLVPGAAGAIERLRSTGKAVLFLTNDPRSSRDEYAGKLRSLGVEAESSQVLTSGAATAQWIAAHDGAAGRSAYVIGSPALKREVESAGLRLVEGEAGREADMVVVGGHDQFAYEELRIASQAVRGGAAFYATGRDATFPMPDGPWPATGAILAAVETAAGRPAHVVGKPEPEMFAVARDLLGDRGPLAVVGDRLDSDIAGGRRAGLATVLVLTGSTTEGEARAASPPPDFLIADLTGLL